MQPVQADLIPEPKDERLEELPEWEDDHARGVDRELGAGVLNVGGTAAERGDEADVDDEEAVADPVVPTIVGARLRG